MVACHDAPSDGDCDALTDVRIHGHLGGGLFELGISDQWWAFSPIYVHPEFEERLRKMVEGLYEEQRGEWQRIERARRRWTADRTTLQDPWNPRRLSE